MNENQFSDGIKGVFPFSFCLNYFLLSQLAIGDVQIGSSKPLIPLRNRAGVSCRKKREGSLEGLSGFFDEKLGVAALDTWRSSSRYKSACARHPIW